MEKHNFVVNNGCCLLLIVVSSNLQWDVTFSPSPPPNALLEPEATLKKVPNFSIILVFFINFNLPLLVSLSFSLGMETEMSQARYSLLNHVFYQLFVVCIFVQYALSLPLFFFKFFNRFTKTHRIEAFYLGNLSIGLDTIHFA